MDAGMVSMRLPNDFGDAEENTTWELPLTCGGCHELALPVNAAKPLTSQRTQLRMVIGWTSHNFCHWNNWWQRTNACTALGLVGGRNHAGDSLCVPRMT